MNYTSVEQLYSLFINAAGVCTDTRKIENNAIFFALKGENFNGNGFAASAIASGCSFAVIDEPNFAISQQFLLVEDVLNALQKLANYHRKQLKTRIIGITGSNGKTTTKELLKSVLSQKLNTYATAGNLNNQIGVPLSLLNLKPYHEVAIIEMGASKQGDIKELVEFAEPDFGLITSIGKAHLEGMGGIEGVVATKTELFDFIKTRNGVMFWDINIELLNDKLVGYRPMVTYGLSPKADYYGEILGSDPFVVLRWKSDKSLEWNQIQSNLTGTYNASNIMSAVAIGSYLGLNPAQIAKGIEDYIPDNNRAQFVKKGSNTLLLDAYNANPTSMEASIRNFHEQNFSHPILILGEMMELGNYTQVEHQHIINLVNELGFSDVHFVGLQFYKLKNDNYHFWQEAASLITFIRNNQPQNSTILFKGSRKNKLETVADSLV